MKSFSTQTRREGSAMAGRKQIMQCPKCNFTFDISYGRTFACSGCPSVVQCGLAKCPKCGHEFPLPNQYQHVYPNLYGRASSENL